ncbi:MAG: Na(+)/H(+) antiporter subunit D [Gammaproteobacteria bacterium]|nr:Na(+)/H(+) antiporter subunit D [Gammaproteobacteria bacterium]
MLAWIPPWIPLILGALVLPCCAPRWRPWLLLGLPLVGLYLVWQGTDGVVWQGQFLGFEVKPYVSSRLTRLFASVFMLVMLIGGLYAMRRASLLELSAASVYAAASVGVIHAGDLLTLFVFWELMAIGSTVVIFAAGTTAAYQAGLRYLLLHLFGGVLLMTGVVAWSIGHVDMSFGSMTDALYGDGLDRFAAWCMLSGFLINAAAPPFSAWVGDAYPQSSVTGMVFLSAFTTKTAVFVLIVGFPGAAILIWLGMAMVVYGVVYALLENDIRRVLAYSIVNQVGFMVCAVGIGSELALNGAAGHAFSHIVYKALLLMSAGAVLSQTGLSRCTELGGLARSMPVSATCAIIGGLSISALPMTGGFVTKSLITSAAGEAHLAMTWLVLTGASACAFLYVGLKFPWFVFFGKDSGLRPDEAPAHMCLAMIALAVLCVLLGVMPQTYYGLLPFPVEYQPYTAAHLVTQFQLLLFAGLAFFLLLPVLTPRPGRSIDFDWFYRSLPLALGRWLVPPLARVRLLFLGSCLDGVRYVLAFMQRSYGPQGLSGVWSSATMVSWVVATLALLVSYYFWMD